MAVQNRESHHTWKVVRSNPAASWPQTASLNEPTSDIPGPAWAIAGKQYTCSIIYKYNTSPASNALFVQSFGTPWILKALHTASSCPISSAGVYFHHTVTTSCGAHSAGRGTTGSLRSWHRTPAAREKGEPDSLMCSKLLWAVRMAQRSSGNLPILPSCSRASPCFSHPPGKEGCLTEARTTRDREGPDPAPLQ